MGDAKLAITTTQENTYQIALTLDNPIPGIPIKGSLTSQGRLKKGYPSPDTYTFSLLFNELKRNKQLNFNWSKQQVTDPQKKRSSPIDDKTIDRLSLLIALQHDLRENLPLHYQITNGKRGKCYDFTQLGTESITTPAGTFLTQVVKSQEAQGQMKLWFFAADNYAPIQAEIQIENNLKIKASLKN